METFGVLLIAADDYPDPPGPLPSSDSARRLSTIVTGAGGGTLIESIVASSHEDLIAAFERWLAPNSTRPLSTIVYLVGHGTDDGLDHSFMVPDPAGIREVRTATLASFFQKDWYRRQTDRGSWTLFVLDCCAADIGVTNLQNELTAKAIKRPRRLALWPATPSGAAHSGSFVEAFGRAVATFTENDAVIPLNEVFERMRPDLGDLEPDGALPPDAVLQNPLRSHTPVVMNLDARAELRRVIALLPDEVRNHFLTKAQAAETGDLAWCFSGRDGEIETLSTWLRSARSGMRVVTGEAGTGKSALLGHLLMLSDERLTEAYAKSGLGRTLAAQLRPPSDVFDAALHLTGRTLAQAVHDLRKQSADRGEPLPPADTADDLLQALQGSRRKLTILADALDEAQEPEAIADFFRLAVSRDVSRVIVGTRRSLGEGPDQPVDPNRRELLDALGASADALVVVGRDPKATREYVMRRLSAEASPYSHDRHVIEALADRIASANQPMLFARLVTSELLARPPITDDDPSFRHLLAGNHRDVFAAAIDRLSNDEPSVVVMLRALALGRGRGVPETGGTWLAIGRRLAEIDVPDTAVRSTVERAAPYVMLDAEAGQSVFRLAHRTFVEHFRSQSDAGAGHRNAAEALRKLVEVKGGWELANYYLVRYLPEHLTADAEATPADMEGLASLATDPAWLQRAVTMLGVDGVVDALSSARRSLRSPFVELQNDALYGIYLSHSRLNEPSPAADALLKLRGNLEATRSAIRDRTRRRGAFADYPYLFKALCEKLRQAGRIPELLEAIEASKGRAVADLLSERSDEAVTDASIYGVVGYLPALCSRHAFHYVTFFVDDEQTYPVLVTSNGHITAPPPVQLSRATIRDAASDLTADAFARLSPLVDWLEAFIDARAVAAGDHLCISPDDDLANVLFACLPIGGRPLAELFSSSLIHNAFHLAQVLEAPRHRPATYLGVVVASQQNVADQQWTAMHEDLRRPIVKVGQYLPGEILEGETVSVDLISQRDLRRRVVHFSTHGFLPRNDPGKGPFEHSGLLLADRGSLPDTAAINVATALTPRAVLDRKIDLTGSHVSLKACVNGLSREGITGHALGMEWAMIQAGAASVLATHSDVSAQLVAAYFEQFYEHWLGRGEPRASAMSATIASLRDAGGSAADAASWGAFVLTGDWR